ncbi:primase-helicase family protein, partial [Vulcanococcus sp.]|uniref:primase-helicase family protein n=1 Tax=Vulcanococcus sp. TaxID=2856995 RepID=UPI003F69EA5B
MAKNQSDEILKAKGPAAKYSEIISILAAHGFYLKINLDSKLTSFHDLYERFNPSEAKGTVAPRGMSYPPWFEFLIPASETTLELIQNELLGSEGMFANNTDLKEFALPLFIYRSGRPSEVTDYVLGVENLKALRHKKMGGGSYRLGIAYSPNSIEDQFRAKVASDVYSYVPELDWFSDKIKNLSFEDIVTIFPPAEAEMFKLIIGRACVGRNGAIHSGRDEAIHHGFRKAGIIVGEPGVGKTTVLNGVMKAMQYCGFNVVNMGDFGSRFNQGAVISSHLAYNDDLTQESLERMLKAHSFKSVVTGGTEKVENKGTDSIEVVSNTVIIANCNEVRSEISYSLDSGAISRLALISTYRTFEQEEMSDKEGRDIHPVANIKYLCKKYNVDEVTLFMRVMRHCTDFFLDKINSGVDVHFHSEQLLPYLRIQIHKNALECFIRFCFLAYAIRDQKGQGDYLPEMTLGSLSSILESIRFLMIDMRANNLRRNMKAHWESAKRDNNHPYWAQRKMLITSVDKAYEIFNSYKSDKDLSLAVESVFNALTLRDGFSMGKKQSHIVRTWEQVRGEKKKIYRMARELLGTVTDAVELKAIQDKSVRSQTDW